MKRGYYSSSISKFKNESIESVLGQLLINDEFETTDLQKTLGEKRLRYFKSSCLLFPAEKSHLNSLYQE